MLERISDQTIPLSIEVVTKLCKFIARLNEILHRNFVREYIPKLDLSIKNYLLSVPSTKTENYPSKQRELISAMALLLQRIHPSWKEQPKAETLTGKLQSCKMLLDSDSPDENLLGLEKLNSTTVEFKIGHIKDATFTNQIFLKYLIEKDILMKICDDKGNEKMKKEIFTFLDTLISEKMLTIEDLPKVYSVLKYANRDIITRVLSKVKYYLMSWGGKVFQKHLVEQLLSTKPEFIVSELFYTFWQIVNETNEKSDLMSINLRDLCWQVILDEKHIFSPDIREGASYCLRKLVDHIDSPDFVTKVLEKCIDNITQRVSVTISYDIIGAFNQIKPPSDKKFAESTYIAYLCAEKNLFELIRSEFNSFKEDLREKMKNIQEPVTKKVLDSFMTEKNYMDNIRDRVNSLLHIYAQDYSKAPVMEIINELWTMGVKNSLLDDEKQLLIEALTYLMVSDIALTIENEDLKKFYNENIMSDEYLENLKKGSFDRCFDCYFAFFITVNEKLGRVSDIKMKIARGYFSSSKHYRFNKFEGDSCDEHMFEFTVNVPPDQLEGLNRIFDFIFFEEYFDKETSRSPSEKAINNLCMIYTHLNNDVKKNAEDIWKGYIGMIKKHLTEAFMNKTSLEKELFTKICLKCLNITERLMCESEKNPHQSFQSHSKMKPGRVLYISSTINNNRYPVKVYINSNKKLSELLDECISQARAYFELKDLTFNDLEVIWERKSDKKLMMNQIYYTFDELGIKESTRLRIDEDRRKPTRAMILQGDNTLDPRAKAVFTRWFEEFSVDGQMGPDNYMAFLNSFNRGKVSINNTKIKKMFENHDTDRDGYLKLDDFLNYYRSIAESRKDEVWNDLLVRGENYDLKQIVYQEADNSESSLRYALNLDIENFDLLYSLLEQNDDIASLAERILSRLKTHPKVFADVATLRGIRDTSKPQSSKWDEFFQPNCLYKCIYVSEVIYSTFYGVQNLKDSLWAQHPQFNEYRKTWTQDFVSLGGLQYLSNIAEKPQKESRQGEITEIYEIMVKKMMKSLFSYVGSELKKRKPAVVKTRKTHQKPLTEDLKEEIRSDDQQKVQYETGLLDQ